VKTTAAFPNLAQAPGSNLKGLTALVLYIWVDSGSSTAVRPKVYQSKLTGLRVIVGSLEITYNQISCSPPLNFVTAQLNRPVKWGVS